MTQDIFSNGIVRLYHISITKLKTFLKIVLTIGMKACNIIQVVSERNTASDGEAVRERGIASLNRMNRHLLRYEKHRKKMLDKRF